MREIEAKQLKKPVNGCSNEVAATAALLSLSASPAAAPAQRNLAGVVAFITPDGTTVIRFHCWSRIVKHAQRLRQKASSSEVVSYLTRKARELETKFGWLKRLWAARLQRVLLRKALQKGCAQRWDNKNDDDLLLPEANCLFTALQVLMREYRAPPELTQAFDTCLFVTSLFIAPSVPRAVRAPTFALPPAER